MPRPPRLFFGNPEPNNIALQRGGWRMSATSAIRRKAHNVGRLRSRAINTPSSRWHPLTRAIIGYRTGKRDDVTTDDFIQDLRARVIGAPEISTDGYRPYTRAIRDAFGSRASHGVVQKTYSVTHLNVKEASRRYSPAQVIAVEYEAVSGDQHVLC